MYEFFGVYTSVFNIIFEMLNTKIPNCIMVFWYYGILCVYYPKKVEWFLLPQGKLAQNCTLFLIFMR
jgi:hypothetical protein